MIRERASFTQSSHGPRLIHPAGVLFAYPVRPGTTPLSTGSHSRCKLSSAPWPPTVYPCALAEV